MERSSKRKTESFPENKAGIFKPLLMGNTSFSGDGIVYGISEGDTPLGAALIYSDMDTVTLGCINVEEAYRGMGIGKSLLEQILKDYAGREQILRAGLMSTQTDAIAFFQAMGFGFVPEEDVYGIPVRALREDWSSTQINMGSPAGCETYGEMSSLKKNAVRRFLQENEPGMEGLLKGPLSQELSMACFNKKGEALAVLLCSDYGENDLFLDYISAGKNPGAYLMKLAGFYFDRIMGNEKFADATYYYVDAGKGIRTYFEGRFEKKYYPAYRMLEAFREI